MADVGEVNSSEFYFDYDAGHRGKLVHEFRPDDKLLYTNNSNYYDPQGDFPNSSCY